jgi:hypothetical protein
LNALGQERWCHADGYENTITFNRFSFLPFNGNSNPFIVGFRFDDFRVRKNFDALVWRTLFCLALLETVAHQPGNIGWQPPNPSSWLQLFRRMRLILAYKTG